jgi:ABC-type amino acid transport substrate-binding protein
MQARGRLGTKLVGVCDAAGRLVDFLLAPGQAHELAPSLALLRRLPDTPSWVLADRACDAAAFRSEMRVAGVIPVVPSRRGANDPQLTYGTAATFSPFEYQKHGKLIGFDIEMGDAVAAKMGLTPAPLNIECRGLIPALQGKRVDVINSAMYFNPRRAEQVDFIPYMSIGNEVVVKKSNPLGELTTSCATLFVELYQAYGDGTTPAGLVQALQGWAWPASVSQSRRVAGSCRSPSTRRCSARCRRSRTRRPASSRSCGA